MLEIHLSKSALLAWVKETTKLPLTRLEDLSTGVHFCQLLYLLTKGKFSMGKVNHNAKLEHENLHNLKLMQYGMEQANIPEKFDIGIIAKKNFRAILEMLQWWHKHFSRSSALSQQPNAEKPKLTFQLKAPMRMDKQRTIAQGSPQKEQNNKTEQIFKMLVGLKEQPQKQILDMEQLKIGKEIHEKENQLYPSLETTEQTEIKFPIAENKSDYSFGNQPFCPDEQKQVRQQPQLQPSEQPVLSKPLTDKEIPLLPPAPSSKLNERPISGLKSVQKPVPSEKQSKTKEEHQLTPASSFRPFLKTLNSGSHPPVESRSVSPRLAERPMVPLPQHKTQRMRMI